MSSTGSRFALFGEAPAEWNQVGLLSESQVAVRLTSGEGFIVEVLSRAFRERLLAGAPQWIFTAHIVREDADLLYGFATVAERALFYEVREIDSIGPKTAAQILGALEARQISELAQGRSLGGVKITGVGPKTLEKLGHGLKSRRDNVLAILTSMGATTSPAEARAQSFEASGSEPPSALVAGLEKLGLRREDVVRIYRDLSSEDANVGALDASSLIRLVLQRWGQYRSKVSASPVEGHS
ncbi:MAG: hypothetical protein JST16_04190 [Bdellovibrionales bacterium]|nr:hypothetical protein [Bdellovibrionales bacterium]